MEATLAGAALGGPGQFVSFWIQNIRGNRLQKAGGVIFFGLGRGQPAVGTGIRQGRRHGGVDAAVGWKRASEGKGMISGQDQGVGQVSTVFNQASPGVATDKGS